MNEPKAETGTHGKNDGQLLYVVDDEPMVLELASVILATTRLSIETFRSPEAALARLRSPSQSRP